MSLWPLSMEERKGSTGTSRAFWAIGEKGGNWKTTHRKDRATLIRAWFLSPLGLSYLCKIGETKGSKSEEIWRTIRSSNAPLTRKREIKKTQDSKRTQVYGAIVMQSRKIKRAHVCVWYFGGTKHTKKNGKRGAFVHSIGFRPMMREPAPPG